MQLRLFISGGVYYWLIKAKGQAITPCLFGIVCSVLWRWIEIRDAVPAVDVTDYHQQHEWCNEITIDGAAPGKKIYDSSALGSIVGREMYTLRDSV